MYSADTCSFNNICKHFNLAENPLKDHFKNILWKMDVTKNSKFGLDWNGPLKVLNRPIRALYLYKFTNHISVQPIRTVFYILLQDDLVVYCAWDVEPLHALYSQLRREISPDYHHLVSQLSEIELIRSVDPALAR